MAFDIVIGSDVQPDVGFDVVIGDAVAGPSMLDFTVPSAGIGSVLLIVVVRNAEVLFSDATWTKVVDGVGASGLFLDAWARKVDGTTGSDAGDVVSVLSVTTQELQGGLIVQASAAITDFVYDAQHSSFAADATPPAPSVTARTALDTVVAIWSADSAVTFTPPTGYTEIDDYGTSVFSARTLLIATDEAGATGSIAPGDATASGAVTGRAFTLAIYDAAPGVTLTAMQAGSVRTKLVAAIEGYANLLTDGNPDAAVVGWDGTGYTTAIGGLYVRASYDQAINPWNPFENSGGSLTLQVVTDSFGVDTHIKSGGTATYADTSVDCNDTTLSALVTGSFASTGTIYVGTEAMSYTGKTSGPPGSFTGLTRGKYSPFLTDADANFAHPHTITEAIAPSVALLPVVSSTPRQWHGKWVGLWRHLESGGLLNVKSDALCTFAGRIVEVKDNPTTMTTDVEVQHVLEYVRDAVIGEDPWKAEIEEGITLAPNMRFDARDIVGSFSGGNTTKVATQLVVTTGATGDYEVEPGRYTLTAIIGILNAWLDAALTDGDLSGVYSFRLNADAEGITHGKFTFQSTGDVNIVVVEMPPGILRALGGFAGSGTLASGNSFISQGWNGTGFEFVLSTGPALRTVIAAALNDIGVGVTIDLINVFGEFYDQAASLPNTLLALLPDSAAGGQIGICMLNDSQPVIVSLSGSDLIGFAAFDPATGAPVATAGDIPFDDATPLKLRQIYVLRDTLANVIKKMFCSTGTTGFNHATHDVYPAILSLGIPFGILTDSFFESVDRLAHADQEITIIIDRPKKLVDILGAALKFRFAFLRWINGHLEFFSWMTPVDGDALAESNKASPVGNQDEQRSASVLSDRWARNVIKIDYDRDFNVADTGDTVFHSHQTIIDRAAIDDAGGKKSTETIPDPTSFTSSFLGGSGSLVATLEHFRSIATMFTRPVRTSRRTIAPTFFEGHSVGDCVLVTDNFARDPDTGERGVSTRPGIIVAHSYEPGGFEVGGGVADMHGEVEIMFLDLLRVGPYVPAANVASVSGTTITCNAHDYSLSDEAADASHFPALSKIRIVQRDPANAAAPLQWDRVVSSQSGNDIVLTASLSSPAYDAALSYRVIFDDYPDAVAAQQTYAYQADDADGQISDTRAPYQYVANTGLIDFGFPTANSASDAVELPPDSSYGDGVGLDVGHMQALNRLAINLYDYKTACSAPILFQTAMTVTKPGTNSEWETILVMPLFLGLDTLTSLVRRKLYVAPMFKTTGNSVSARITLSRMPPTGDSFTDGVFSIPKASATFSTTSTTYTTPTPVGISFGQIKDNFGLVYLTLEMQVTDGVTTASCRGIACAYEGPRE